MLITLLIVGAVVLLALRAIYVQNLPAEDRAKLEGITCPICRTNMGTILAVHSLWLELSKLAHWAVTTVRHHSTKALGTALHEPSLTGKRLKPPTV